MTNETSRYRWPVPAWNADWQQWQGVFRDLVTNVDSTVFSSVDGNRLMFESLPNASIVSSGPGYNLSMSGPLVIRSRTHSVSITVPVGTTALTANSVLALTVTPGAVGAQSIEWQTFMSGIDTSPDIIPFGYVDDSYNIIWWNGAQLTAGGSALPLFGSASGGGGGDVTKVGTPVNDQVAVWTGNGTVEGDSNLTFDGSNLSVGGNIIVGGTVDGINVGADVAANTAKVTNATHTGDVTGSGALSIASGVVGVAHLSATGTPSASTYLRGDNTWAAASGGGTLDDAYDYGGSGAGRAITADSGAVTVTNAVADTTGVLELSRSVGTGNVLKLQNDYGGYPDSTNRKSIFLTAASPAAQTIWSDQELYIGTSEPVLGMYVQNKATGGALLRVQAEAVTTGDSVMWVTANGATADNSTGYLLLQAAGAGTGGQSKIEMRATAGSTGPGVVDIYASGGAASVNIGGDDCDVRLNDDNRAGSTWTGQEFIQLSASSAEWDLLESNCSGEVSLINAINLAFAGGSGNTLDGAYDQGGSGVGRTITADSGAVAITNAANDSTDTLELTRSDGGVSATGSPLRIINDLDTFQTESGSSIFLTSTGSGKQSVWSDKELYIGSTVNALGVYLKNVADTSSILRVQSEAAGTSGSGQLWLTSSGANNGTAELLVQASGSGTGGLTEVEIKASAGSTGPGVLSLDASGGSAYILAGSSTCKIRLDDQYRSGSTWTGQSYITLSDSSAEWSSLESNCSGEVSLIGAINLAFAGGGGGGMSWSRITSNTTATSGNGYLIDAASNTVTLSLPASPSEGDIVGVQVYDSTYNVAVNRNTNNVEGSAYDPYLTKGDAATFVYAEATEGWVRVSTAGGKIHTSLNATTATLDAFSDSVNGAVQYQYFISNAGTNIRSGTVRAHWDGVGNTYESDDSAVTSIGDTDDFTFTVDIDSGLVRLRATATKNYNVIRLVKTII